MKGIGLRALGHTVCIILALGVAASKAPEVPKELVSGFVEGVASGEREQILPYVTEASRRLILKEPRFIKQLQKLYNPEADKEFLVERTRDGVRVDFLPLLRFYPALYLEERGGAFEVDLLKASWSALLGRPKDEVLSICRRSLKGVVDPAKVDFYETSHFLILAHTGPIPAKKTGELLEELYIEFERAFPLTPRGAPPRFRGAYPYSVVFLFDRSESYRSFAAKHNPGTGRFAGHANILGYMVTYFRPGYESTVSHEGTHLLMSSKLGIQVPPRWFAEGMAEFMSNRQSPAVLQENIRKWFREDKVTGFESIFTNEKFNGEKDYRMAESIFTFLYEEHNEHLLRYTRWLAGQAKLDSQAYREHLLMLLRTDIEGFRQQWMEYLRKKTTPPPEKPPELEPVSEPLASAT